MTAPKLPPWTLALAFGIGSGGLLLAVHLQYPIGEWLIWRYCGYWCLSLLWVGACLGLGLRLLDAFRFAELRSDERWVFGMALGILSFGMVMLLLGFVGLWSSWAFVLLPSTFLAIGRRELADSISACGRWLGQTDTQHRLAASAVVVAGVVGAILIYLPILSPRNIGFDARWYHLAIAEQYAVRGGIEPFTHGWLLGAYPQLASAIYGWAFLMPFGALFDRIELCLHLELMVFVATLASVPALARTLIDEPQPRAWVFMLLFPGLYLYDSSLIAGADHIAAFWAVPIALAAYRAWNDFSTPSVLLATVFASAALLTKYTAAGLTIGPGALLLGRGALLVVRGDPKRGGRRRALTALGLGAATGLLLTSPHWLKNFVFYGDPLLPFLHGTFKPDPWVADAADRLTVFADSGWKAKHTMRDVLNTLGAPFTFAFWPHNWTTFHGSVPVFGFLYTLTMPAVLFVPKRARIIALYVVISVGVMFWYWTFHQDRYLQSYLPWMAACVAAVVTQAWRLGRTVRAGLVLLIGAQVIAGAGVPFLPTHAMTGKSPYSIAVQLMGGWRSKKRVDFDVPFGGVVKIESKLPRDARVLVHDENMTLGIARPAVVDAIGWQVGIDYNGHVRPSEMWRLLRSYDVSHVVWKVKGGYLLSSIGAEVGFYFFAMNYLEDIQRDEGLRVGRIPDEPPADDRFSGKVAVLGCEDSYANGIYSVEDLTATWLKGPPSRNETPKPERAFGSRPKADELATLLAGVDAVRIDEECFPNAKIGRLGFARANKSRRVTLYVRQARAEATLPSTE